MSCDVGDLEDGTYAPRDELRGSVDALLPILDEDGDFVCARRFQNFSHLSDGLLKNIWRADIDFGDDDHYGHIKRQGNSQMFFAHADEAVVGGDHQQAVVRFAGEQAKDGGP